MDPRAWRRSMNEGALRYCGHGIVESAGMRKGLDRRTRPGGQSREGGQRTGRARGARQYRASASSAWAGRTFAASIPMAESSWVAACARSTRRMCAVPSSGRAPWSGLRTARFCTCCAASSSSTTSPASLIRLAWWAKSLKWTCTSPPAPAAPCKARSPAPIAPVLR